MWLFDADCAVLGSARGVSVPYTGLGGGSKVVPYNFDSSLDYVTVTDLGNGSEPVDIWYVFSFFLNFSSRYKHVTNVFQLFPRFKTTDSLDQVYGQAMGWQ